MAMSAGSQPLRGNGFRAARLITPATTKLAAGTLLMLAILYGQTVYGYLTSGSRLDPALRGVTEPVNVVVVLPFRPERFHNERLVRYGVFSGRDGAATRVRLNNVSPEMLHSLARLPWVAYVERR